MLNDNRIMRRMEFFPGNPRAIEIEPRPKDAQIQPASVDLCLGDVDTGYLEDENGRFWSLEAGRFVLASTLEVVSLGSQIAARVEGKSSWGRRGLMIHCAGFIDPGFSGQITLELKNLGHSPIRVYADTVICQVAFFDLGAPASRPYGSKGIDSRYQNQRGPTPAIEGQPGERRAAPPLPEPDGDWLYDETEE